MKAQILVSSEGNRKGKTVFTSGLLLALKRRNLRVQPFKCGPNCTDAMIHEMACGVHSVNLDLWMSTSNEMKGMYNAYGEKADVTVVEGDKGLFDGYDCMKGSSAEIASKLSLSVVLVVDAKRTSYTMAALIYGLTVYRKNVRVVGVVFNQVSSEGQYAFLKQTCRDAGVPCLGYIPVIEDLQIPGINQGVLQRGRMALQEKLSSLASEVERHVDLDRLLALSQAAFPCAYDLPYDSGLFHVPEPKRLNFRTAIPTDAAFHAVMHQNLEYFEEKGRVIGFSVLHSGMLPEADFYYFPGGSLNLHARLVHRNKQLLNDIKWVAEQGAKMFVEGSSFALFASTMRGLSENTEYQMAGVFDAKCKAVVTEAKPAGYRSVECNGVKLYGYESTTIACSKISNTSGGVKAVQVYDVKGSAVSSPFVRYKNVIASLASWHWSQRDLFKLWD